MPQIVSQPRWIVLKFGGTSVSKRERWDTIGKLAGERRAEREEYLLGVAGDVLPPGSAQQFFSPDEAAEFEHLG